MGTSFRVVETQQGSLAFVVAKNGLRQVYLPDRSKDRLRRRIRRDYPQAEEHPRLMPEFADALRRYVAGDQVEFDVRFDMRSHSSFEVDVWNACRRVGYGKTASYGQIAERAGRPGAARAVGTAMSHNPFPLVVPCHRIVKSDGSLGGYSGPGGVSFKQRLLEMEGAYETEPI